MKKSVIAAGLLPLALASMGHTQGVPSQDDQQDFTKVPIEELMKVDVTDAFKSPIPLMKAPAAIYVVTQNMISRSGVTTLPEALRLVPGVEVSRIGTVYYSISIRGFGSYLASNKILVLVDGRTIYSPYQNTVYWEIEDVVMEDIDRIEVIMGPGGSLWGANAVNGVINIITKNSKDTKGDLLVQSAGDLDRNRSVFRYGGSLSDDATYRIYGKYGTLRSGDSPDGTSNHASMDQFGFRTDLTLPGRSSLMVEGETAQYNIAEQQPVALVTPPYSATYTNTDLIQTDHLLAKWTRDSTAWGQTSIQSFFDLINYPYTDQASSAAMYDIQVEQRLPNRNHQEIAFGGGYRYMLNDAPPGPSVLADPENRRDTIFNIFGQDILHINLKDTLTTGIKIEHNDICGFELQPNVRYTHIPNESQTFWAAVGKADRTPSQSELNVFSINNVSPPIGGALPVATANIGNPNLQSETVVSNEVGFRQKLSDRASFDVAGFYNIYNNLVYLAPGSPFTSTLFGPPVTVDPSYFQNGGRGQTYGFESHYKFDFSPTLRTDLWVSAIQSDRFKEGSDLAAPPYQVSAHVAWDATRKLQFDGRLSWRDAIIEDGIPAYVGLDLHAIWKLSKTDELSLGGYNLLSPRHIEFEQGAYIFRSFIAEYKRRF